MPKGNGVVVRNLWKTLPSEPDAGVIQFITLQSEIWCFINKIITILSVRYNIIEKQEFGEVQPS